MLHSNTVINNFLYLNILASYYMVFLGWKWATNHEIKSQSLLIFSDMRPWGINIQIYPTTNVWKSDDSRVRGWPGGAKVMSKL